MKFIRKFILEGDEVNPNNEPDEKGDERKVWNTAVVHVPENRQTDGRWKGTIVQEKGLVKEIKWAGLYDKNSDIQYAPRQLVPKSYYEQHFERREDNRTIKFRKMLDGAKKNLIFK